MVENILRSIRRVSFWMVENSFSGFPGGFILDGSKIFRLVVSVGQG